MHIAIDARIINSTTGRYVERLLHYLEQVDKTNTYTILVRKKDLDFWKLTNNNFSVLEADFSDYSFGEQVGLLKLLSELKPDLVHFCMPQQPILYRDRHVTTMHDLTLLKTYNSDKNWLAFHIKQLIGRGVFWWIARSSAEIITPSMFTKAEYQKFARIDSEKIHVIYESADISKKRPKKYNGTAKKYILYVGQQSDYKNVRRLASAHQQLLEKYPDLQLVLVGKKNTSALRNEKLFKKQSYRNIHFTGFVDDAELAWLYKNCQAYVFPSLMEGFGLPGLEAMLYGAPVVSSNATCLPEVYGNAAHYFNPHYPGDIAQAIDEVLRDDKLRAQLIKNGAQQIKKYSWKKMAQETLKVYKKATTK